MRTRGGMALFVSVAFIYFTSFVASNAMGQSSPYFGYIPPASLPSEDLVGVNYQAIDSLYTQAKVVLPPETPSQCEVDCQRTQSALIVTTLVNINQLESTTPFGRLVSEHVSGRLAQHGYGVIELKIREKVQMKQNSGEFLLTRDILQTAKSHQAQAVVVGTYMEASDRVFVSIKMVEAGQNKIIGAVDYSLTKSELVKSLLISK